MNYDGGWANAAQGIRLMTANVIAQCGKVLPGKSVVGVHFTNGTMFDASLVILATGSWTASSFPDFNLVDKMCFNRVGNTGVHLDVGFV